MTDPQATVISPSGLRQSTLEARVARPVTPEEVLALMRGVTGEHEFAQRLSGWRRASTDPAIPRFDLRGAIGKGSQGTVWSVADRDFLRQVAIKTMHERDRLPEDVSRFVHEAQITAQLEHPGVVPVHDLQVLPDGTVFYVMKRIEGQTLADLMPDPERVSLTGLDRQRLDLLDIVLKVLDTVAFAHSRGVIHRDLKPRNIMVGRFGEVLVLDWGLAKIVDAGDDTPRHGPAVFSLRSMGEDGGSANATGVGCAVGTPAFMSPEQASGKPADQRSDLYGIGVIIYHALTGYSPYDVTAGARHVLEQVANGVWVALDERPAARGIPRRLIAIVHKALALDPRDRYVSAEAMALDLRNFLAGEAVAAYRESPLDKCVRLVSRHQRVLVTGLAVAGVAAVIWSALEMRHAAQRQQQVVEARTKAAQRELAQDWDEARRVYERLLDLEPGDRLTQQALLRIREAIARRTDAELLLRKRASAQELVIQARRLVEEASDASLREAQKAYLGAFGLTPDDQTLTSEYGQLVTILASREEVRRQRQVEAERQAQANELRRKAVIAEKADDLQVAINCLEGANALIPRTEEARHIAELMQRIEAAERTRREMARRAEADAILGPIQALALAGHGREARERIERARGIEPAHPSLPALESQVQAAERIERERSAEKSLAEASGYLEMARTARARALDEERRCRQLADALADGPTDDARRALQRAETARDQARLARAKAQADALAALHQARTEAPWHIKVNAALADFYVDRLREAEAEGLLDEAAAAEAQAKAYDDGSRASLIAGQATIRVQGQVPLKLSRIERNELRLLLPAGEEIEVAPGDSVVVKAGRWLAVTARGVRLALRVGRGETRDLALPSMEIPLGTVLVPGMGRIPTVAMMVHEVTCGEYLAFLNDPLVRQTFESARAAGRLIRLPRATHTSMDPLWRLRGSSLRSGAGSVMECTDGRAIDLKAPVTGISAEDAMAFAVWRSQRDHLRWRLPTLAEWRHAAQGGDGRAYPWGDAADLGLCASGPSCAGLSPDVLPEVGSYPLDRSVQGVEDLAGSVSEFVDGGDETVVTAGNVRLVPLLGGSRFDLQPERFSVNYRRDMDPRFVHPGAGFRLVCDP